MKGKKAPAKVSSHKSHRPMKAHLTCCPRLHTLTAQQQARQAEHGYGIQCKTARTNSEHPDHIRNRSQNLHC